MSKTSAQRVLILGASGNIGRALQARCGAQGSLSTWNSRPLAGAVRFDCLTESIDSLDLAGIGSALVLLGNTNPDACARDPKASNALNVDAMIRLFDDLGNRGIHAVFTSSESVFDGRKGNYVEEDPADPLMLYGVQKRIVEDHITRHWPQAAIVRIAKVYSTTPGDGSLFDGWARQAAEDVEIRAASDFCSSVVQDEDVADGLLAVARQRLAGLYHLGGPQSLSRFDMCRALLAALAERITVRATVASCSIDDFPTVEPRPKNISMSSAKLIAATGFSARTAQVAAREYAARLEPAA